MFLRRPASIFTSLRRLSTVPLHYEIQEAQASVKQPPLVVVHGMLGCKVYDIAFNDIINQERS